DRFQGVRLFREGNASDQTIKANIGIGSGESWNDGGVIDVAAGEWVHIALSISATQSTIFFNGVPVRTAAMTAPIDWTGCDELVIGSGGDTFSYWDHKSDNSPMDELRLFNTALTEADIQNMINVTNPYAGEIDGEMFYLPCDGDNKHKFTATEADIVGAPRFAGVSVTGSAAFAGAAGPYPSFPTTRRTTTEFSATMWYQATASPG